MKSRNESKGAPGVFGAANAAPPGSISTASALVRACATLADPAVRDRRPSQIPFRRAPWLAAAFALALAALPAGAAELMAPGTEPLSIDRFARRELTASPALSASGDGVIGGESRLKQYTFDDYGNKPISFYYCQAGFRPTDYKPVYVWTREAFKQGSALLRNCTSGAEVSVPLASHGVNIWGRQDWIADCSEAMAEGDYVLRVKFGTETAETAPFRISQSCYEELREKAAKHYFLKRCGIFCHPHDGNLYSLDPATFGQVRARIPAYGGWHDAHDDNKWLTLTWTAIYGLLKTQERFSPRWNASNEPYPYCLAEAWWGVDWLLRMQKPDGTFYSGVFEWFPIKQADRMILRVHHRAQNYDDLHRDQRAVLDVWGENAICDVLGRPPNTAPSIAPAYFAYCAHVLRYCGRLMQRYDVEKAERCRRGSRAAVAYLEKLDSYPPSQELEVHATLALYWLEEAKDGGGTAALGKMEKYLREVMARQQPQGHFHSSQTCRGLEFHWEEAGEERFIYYPFAYVHPIIEYLEHARQAGRGACALVNEAQEALGRFARMLGGFCNGSVFRHPSEPRFDRKPAVILPVSAARHGYNPYILSAGVVFATAARLAGYREGNRLAHGQLQWVFGANPRFMSFMNQVGVRNVGQYAAASSVTANYYPMAFYRHLRDKRWGVTTGMYGPQEGRQSVDFPNAGDSMFGRYNHLAQETWLNCNGWLLLLLSYLEE